MTEAPVSVPTPETWADALLTSGSEALLNAVRNYIGPVRTPYDKRDLVKKLEAFLKRAESQDSLIALLDEVDARIAGATLLLGPVPEHELKELFAGDLSLFELGVRIANLHDRLILFRYTSGDRRLVAVNPILVERLAPAVLDPALLFSGPAAAEVEETELAGGDPCDASSTIGFFAFLFHFPGALRKGGGLTKRAAERAAALLPALGSKGERLPALARALAAAGLLSYDGDDRAPDRAAFVAALRRWGEDLPFFLASALAAAEFPAGGETARPLARLEAVATVASSALRDPPGAQGREEVRRFSRSGLERWLGLASKRAGLSWEPGPYVSALLELGIMSPGAGPLSLALPARSGAGKVAAGRLVAEGAHALHLLPEAGLEDRLFVGCVARPLSLGTVWSFEIERDSIRRGFASGLDAKTVAARLSAMAAAPLPQSLVFSLDAWEEEYRALRLYRGVVLVAEERFRAVVENSAALGEIVAEVLAPGVYFLSAQNPAAAAAALARAGLEASPRIAPEAAGRYAHQTAATQAATVADVSGRPFAEVSAAPHLEEIGALRQLLARGTAAEKPPLDPSARLAELRRTLGEALRSGARSAEEGRELEDRIARRLVLTERQIAEAEVRPERLEAGGLDYLGKVRVVERALRSPGDRLEVLYRLPGAEPVRTVLRPVKLDRNEKGLVLEAEDLATGGPARVPLGAVSTVRRVRASLFGEDT